MARKAWETAIGEPVTNPLDGDSLLAQSKSDRERKRIKRQEDEDEAAHQARMADFAKKTATSSAAVEKTSEKKEDTGGIKTKGEFNIGNFNIQEMLQQQIADRDKLKSEAEEAASRNQQISDDLRERLHTSEMQVLKTSFEAQMQLLTKMIEANSSKGGFTEQLNAAREIAKELGYSQGTSGAGSSEMIQIELKKLDFEHQIAMRKMGKEDKAEERRWQIELRRLDDERETKKAELAQQAKKDEFVAKAPEAIGAAIAKGLMVGGGGAEVASSPSPRGIMPGITAGIGESGEAECTQCHQPVAVGPTARTAVCAGCGAKYPIRRVQAKVPEEASEEEE